MMITLVFTVYTGGAATAQAAGKLPFEGNKMANHGHLFVADNLHLGLDSLSYGRVFIATPVSSTGISLFVHIVGDFNRHIKKNEEMRIFL